MSIQQNWPTSVNRHAQGEDVKEVAPGVVQARRLERVVPELRAANRVRLELQRNAEQYRFGEDGQDLEHDDGRHQVVNRPDELPATAQTGSMRDRKRERESRARNAEHLWVRR